MRRLAKLLLCLACCLVMPALAGGQRVWVALSGTDSHYLAAAQALREQLPGVEVTVRPWREYGEGAGGRPDVVVALGTEAMQRMVEADGPWRGSNVVALLVSRAALEKAATGHRGRVTGIYFDQPFSRQMRFLRLAMPESRRVGILLGPDSMPYAEEILLAAKAAGLAGVTSRVENEEGLHPALRDVLSESDVLLAIPDDTVLNNRTARHILLASYRRRVPLVGYSSSFVKAGAVAALVTTPEQMGQQAGEMVAEYLSRRTMPPPRPPDAFDVVVNSGVARSLELALDGPALARRMGGERGGP